jgi:endonuclease YncB( thermonuclease family)
MPPELRDHDKAETIRGMRARALTADLLAAAGHKVSCQSIEWDSYCRVVATCTAGGKDLTLELLKAGMSYGFYLAKHPDHIAQALSYSNAEAEARKERRGLWLYWLGERPPVERSASHRFSSRCFLEPASLLQ